MTRINAVMRLQPIDSSLLHVEPVKASSRQSRRDRDEMYQQIQPKKCMQIKSQLEF